MRPIDLIIIHCTATKENVNYTPEKLEADHKAMGFQTTGYHFYVRRNGDIITTRPLSTIGAHAKGHNKHSIGIAYEGGLDRHGLPADTRTEWQMHSLKVLVLSLLMDYPHARVVGHRDLSPDLDGDGTVSPLEWTKQCPCFDVDQWLEDTMIKKQMRQIIK